jgi:flagellar motor component MotA
MRIIGLLIVVVLMGLAMGNEVSIFIDIPSALIVLGFTLGALIFARAGIPNMFAASFSAEATKEQLQAAARGWAQARTYLVASGFIGVLIGGVIMLKNMDDPAAIGPGAAIAIITIFYGLLLAYGLCLPMQARLEDRAREKQG